MRSNNLGAGQAGQWGRALSDPVDVVDEGGGSEVLVPVVGSCAARAVLGPFFCGGPVCATAVAVTVTSYNRSENREESGAVLHDLMVRPLHISELSSDRRLAARLSGTSKPPREFAYPGLNRDPARAELLIEEWSRSIYASDHSNQDRVRRGVWPPGDWPDAGALQAGSLADHRRQ